MSTDDAPERGVVAWMAGRPIAANLLMFVLLGGGAWTAMHLQREVLPYAELDVVEVAVAYPGAAPAEVEQGILLPIEEAIRGISGVAEITSSAREGQGTVLVELVTGTDRMLGFQEVDQAVSRIRTFPEDIEEPQVRLVSEQRGVVEVVLYGQVDPWTLRGLAEQLRDQLLNDAAITLVEIGNAPSYVTHVEIPQDRLRAHGLTLDQVARRIAESSQDVPAGAVETRMGEILLRLTERKLWARELGEIPIATAATGEILPLKAIATITDGFEEAGFHSQFNQQPSVELDIFRIGEQSPIDISDAVDRVLAEFAPSLPPGVHHRIGRSTANDFSQRLSLLLENGLLAVVIVLVILGLFLEIRLAFWVTMGMVTSFIGAFVFLPVIDVSINMISMFAFLVALGIVVDDAIVVGENVYEYRQQGMSPMQAAIRGTKDIALPVVFTILSNIVAFVPVLFMPGATGRFWWPLPAVVITVLVVSLIEALFILPAHLAHSGKPRRSSVGRTMHRVQQAFLAGFTALVRRVYAPFLELCLRWRYVTLTAAGTLLLVVGGYALSDHMGMIMMPQVAADEIEAGVRLPVGTTPEQAAAVAHAVTASTLEMFEKHGLDAVSEGVKTNVRRQTFIDVEIVMKPPDQREMTAAQVIALWRDEIGDLEGVSQVTFEAERGPGGWRDDISVDLSHTDLDVLEAAARAFFDKMETFEATRDVNDNYEKGKAQLDFRLRPEAARMGLTAAHVGRQLRDAFHGALAARQLRGTNEVEIRVKLPRAERHSLVAVERFVVRTPDGAEVPLGEIADIQVGAAFASLTRRAGRRVITVGMDVEPQRETTRVMRAIQEQILPALRADYPGLTYRFQGTQAEMRASTSTLWGGFALAMFLVYALLAVAFRSYTQPLIVMVAIPFGIIGAVLGHILLGFDLSIVSLMGIIALSGVVVNDSLIMVDYANRKRADLPLMDAVRESGVRRFRPIILTSLTTFGGLTPIILERSLQAQHLIPMAISLGFGIVFATAIILVIVPCLYLVLEDLRPSAASPAVSDASG